VTARALSSLTATDLGMQITAPKVKGNRKKPIQGTISSLRHFTVDDTRYTSVIVKVNTNKGPDHREIKTTSDAVAEVTGR
jgi:hypothetical protein